MKNEKLLLWEQRIKDCRNSKLSVASWCAQHQISQATYYYWHKKVTHKNNFGDNTPPVLADVTPLLKKDAPVTSAKLKISWNQLCMNVSNTEEAELAAVFISKLQQLC